MARQPAGRAQVGALALGALLAIGAMSPALGQPTSGGPTSAQVDALIQDIRAHKQMCDKVDPAQADLVRQCANEQAALLARQQRLGVSDEALNDKLKARGGWRWP